MNWTSNFRSDIFPIARLNYDSLFYLMQGLSSYTSILEKMLELRLEVLREGSANVVLECSSMISEANHSRESNATEPFEASTLCRGYRDRLAVSTIKLAATHDELCIAAHQLNQDLDQVK